MAYKLRRSLSAPTSFGGTGGHFEAGAALGNQSWPLSYFQIAASNKLKFVHIGRTAFAGKINFLEST